MVANEQLPVNSRTSPRRYWDLCSADGSCCLLFPKQSQGIAVQPEFHISSLLTN